MTSRFVHLNGPPGIGKSTLSALYADRNPGTLNVDVDILHRLVGGWQDEQTDTWPVVWSLVRAMAALARTATTRGSATTTSSSGWAAELSSWGPCTTS